MFYIVIVFQSGNGYDSFFSLFDFKVILDAYPCERNAEEGPTERESKNLVGKTKAQIG